MAKVVEVKVESNREEVLAAARSQINSWLQAIGEDAASTAAERVPVKHGLLKGSISSAVVESENAVYIGTNVDYAIYHEFGTGEYASAGSNAKRIPWAFQDENGQWHMTSGVPARHFLQFGITAHQEEYRGLLEEYLKG